MRFHLGVGTRRARSIAPLLRSWALAVHVNSGSPLLGRRALALSPLGATPHPASVSARAFRGAEAPRYAPRLVLYRTHLPKCPPPRISAHPSRAGPESSRCCLRHSLGLSPAGLEPVPKWAYAQRSAINTRASSCTARGVARRSLRAALTGETSPLSQSPAPSPATQKMSLRVGVGGRQARRGWSLVVPGLSEGRFGWSRKVQGREVAGAPSPGNRVGA